jgi:hypothetical protein
MLITHFKEVENVILSQARIQRSVGHNNHKGTPREIFIREYLEKHSSEIVAFGSGEIIDAASLPGEKRNQIDIVIYKKEYPKLDFGGNVSGFLAESVIATIEVKSNLDEKEFESAYLAAINCKRLKRTFHHGLKMWYDPPAIQNYIIAYDGPEKMATIFKWIKNLDEKHKTKYHDMPVLRKDRINIPSPTLDGIFVLGKGFVHFDNFMISNLDDSTRMANPDLKWIFGNSKDANLFTFFMNLTQSICFYNQKAVDIMSYLENKSIEIENYGIGI